MLESDWPGFRQGAVEYRELGAFDLLQWRVPATGVLVPNDCVSLAERAACAVLSGESHGDAVLQHRSECQRLGVSPIDVVPLVIHRLGSSAKRSCDGGMHLEIDR